MTEGWIDFDECPDPQCCMIRGHPGEHWPGPTPLEREQTDRLLRMARWGLLWAAAVNLGVSVYLVLAGRWYGAIGNLTAVVVVLWTRWYVGPKGRQWMYRQHGMDRTSD